MRPQYSNPHKRDEFPPRRQFALKLLRESQQMCDPDYATEAAGFWLDRQAPESQRGFYRERTPWYR